MKAWSFQDNTVHSKNCGETLKINGSATIFSSCYFLLSLMLSHFWGDFGCVCFWETFAISHHVNYPRSKQSCSWVWGWAEDIQFSQSHMSQEGAKHHYILLWPRMTMTLYTQLGFFVCCCFQRSHFLFLLISYQFLS